MCGIAGVFRLDGSRPDPQLLARMSRTLAHRGPDGEGSWLGSGAASGIGLAHRRLSIIDLGGSAQPMTSADGRYVIVFNGEILNYEQLRSELDYPWRTKGDTETLLAAFVLRGTAAFELVTGQFACAVVDTVSGELWLARDRTGILPLYWTRQDRTIAFASELKALVPVTGPLEVDPDGLDDYLMRRAVVAPGTLVRGVSKVPPGMVLHVRPAGTQLRPYWSLPDVVLAERPEASGRVTTESAAAATDELDRTLREAVRRNLVADVEVGTYLSGGVDSSLITALAAGLRPGVPTMSFSAGFGDPRVDETRFARQIAAHVGTVHHEVNVTAEDFRELWPLLTWHRDAPVSEPADVAVFRLARTAREHVKVVLSGEGSDELFGGYPKHAFAGVTSTLSHLPAGLRARPLTAAERLLPERTRRLRIAMRAMTGRDEADMFAAWFAPFTAQERHRLTGRPPRRAPVVPVTGDALTRMLVQDCTGWLPDNLLERGDRMSMAASLELRPPFLDRDVVDLAFRLPSALKVRGRTGKWVVKEVARRYLPATVVDRPKSGFRVPLDVWLRQGLRELAWDTLTAPGSLSSTMLDPVQVKRLLQSHDSSRRNEDIRVWTLLSLEVWYRTCVLGDAEHPPAPSGS